ncbi:MAG: hypothetical protein CVT73_02155 [Alphaproteobacteria bacterium HGW-Alphaproteobacteria-12]|nr:MAG: hypothetical protein CVT73_02155 [Alphaproteobacteria bacterium HGW-Alphaproteobacteria-12]
MRLLVAITLLSVLAAAQAWAAPVCATRDMAAPALSRLQDRLADTRFVAYQPTALKVWDGNPVPASEASIRADLMALRPWFDGLVTYGAHSGAERIPAIADELGYRAVVVGIWNPQDDAEVENARLAWKENPDLVVGVSLGNEIVFAGRGDWSGLTSAVTRLHARAPALPVTVSEPFSNFLDDPGAAAVLAELDFLAVNIHPAFESWFQDAPPFNWADFVVKVSGRLATEAFCGPIFVKETGLPTAPAEEGFTPEKQAAFWMELAKQMPRSRSRAFAYFSAFDAPWRVYDFTPDPEKDARAAEGHWGLFTENRAPKQAMEKVPRLTPAPAP